MKEYKPWEESHLFIHIFLRGMHSKSCLVTLGALVMSLFVKTYIYVKVELGDNHGWKGH